MTKPHPMNPLPFLEHDLARAEARFNALKTDLAYAQSRKDKLRMQIKELKAELKKDTQCNR